MDKDKLIRYTELPERWAKYIPYLYTAGDIEVIEKADNDGYVAKNKLSEEEFKKAYCRGVLDKCKEKDCYKVSGSFTRIDCLIRGELEIYKSFPDELKEAIISEGQDIDLWVMPKRREGHNMSVIHPLPLEKAIEVLKEHEGIIYAQNCDCKTFHDDKKHMRNGCMFFVKEDELENTNLDRGYGHKLDLDEAIKLMRACDKDGLVHNYEHDSFCNCCPCCCWAFRGIQKFAEKGYSLLDEYVKSDYVIEAIPEKCRGCGKCAKICPMKALNVVNGKIQVSNRCIGCGVCRGACAFGALEIADR